MRHYTPTERERERERERGRERERLPQCLSGKESSVSVVKNPPAMQEPQETQVQSLSWEDPRKEGRATHSSILAWRIPIDRRAWKATVYSVIRSQTRLK